MEYFPARHQDLELWTGGQQRAHLLRRIDHLLKVVQQQQHLLLTQKGAHQVKQWVIGDFFDAKRLGDRRHDQSGVADGSQVDEKHAIGEGIAEFGGNL